MKKIFPQRLEKGDWHGTLLASGAKVREAINVLNQVSLKIVLVVDRQGRLEGTVSDGDIRRGLLRGCDLDSPLAKVLRRNPLVAHPTHRRDAIARLMSANEVQQIPIVDAKRRVVGLHVWDQVAHPPARPNLFVIMAGGEGKRLRPYTADRPKPLVEVGGRPILEHILEKAKAEGFSRFVIAVHYLGGMIEKCFGNGKRLGIQISYLREKKPMGTAGALRLLRPVPREPFLVTNGDVLADFQYGDLLDFHVRHGADATMAVRTHEWRNPYGVVETRGHEITGFLEKPLVRAQINAGVYALNPCICQKLRKENRCHMPELFTKLRMTGSMTLAYPLHELWVDVGRPEDLINAKTVAKTRKTGK